MNKNKPTTAQYQPNQNMSGNPDALMKSQEFKMPGAGGQQDSSVM